MYNTFSYCNSFYIYNCLFFEMEVFNSYFECFGKKKIECNVKDKEFFTILTLLMQ